MAGHSRLSALDAAFLQVEGSAAHMHVGGVLLFDGPAPAYDELVEMVESRLPRLPRWRQRLAWPAAGLLRPCWVDDPRFDARFHIRHAGLPHPHSEGELKELAGRLFGQPLDRSRPLWELHLVDGIDGDRCALVAKIHHALADGVSGVDIAALLLDVEPSGGDGAPAPSPSAPRAVAPPPSEAELIAGAARDQAREVGGALRGALGALRHPADAALALARTARDATDLVEARLDGAPASPYNVPISATRRYTWTRVDLAQVKQVGLRAGATVNDVVLAAVAGGLRRQLQRRDHPVDGLELKAMVPVSVREEAEHGELGNRITTLFAPLPVGIAEAGTRLRRVREVMAALKRSGQAAGGQALSAAGELMPPALMGLVAKQMASPRLFNLTVTNIPGPPVPLYLLGRRMHDVFPLVPLAEDHALGIAIMSYDGTLDLGLLGCADALPDLDDLADDVQASFAELAGPFTGRRFTPRRRPPVRNPAPVR
jgi:diacylglycerol O-acyltransferase / wax synthase